MKSHIKTTYLFAVAFFATLALAMAISTPVYAQTASFPDVPANHWAYQAVTDLANKGYVKGYPNGQFLGGRALTRYEFATVIDRMVQEIDDLNQKVAQGQPPTTPASAPVTQDDLNKIQVLVDGFKDQLAAIQSTAATQQAQFQSEMDKLRSDLAAVKTEADNSFGAGPGRKYTISGYIQARYITTGSSSEKNFPQGNPTANNSYNGTYATGSNNGSFVLRRSRIKLNGQITQHSAFDIQIDAPGFSNNTPSGTSNSSNSAVTVKEGWASYTFGNGDASRYPTMTAGQFADPFGYILPLTTAATLSPERPLAFNEGSAGLFSNEDYERGVQVVYAPSVYRFLFAAINGTGTVSDDESHRVDTIYKIGAHTKDNVLAGDVSYWYGHVPFTKTIGTNYIDQKKELWDADAQFVSPYGPFLIGEYVAGKYEQRAFFGETAATATNPFGFGAANAPGNMVSGYYVQGGWTFDPAGSHPLSLILDYDVLNRSASGVGAKVLGGASGSSFEDENVGYGVLYNLDKATRIRLFYVLPDKVAHATGTAQPPRVGLTTAEVQVKY